MMFYIFSFRLRIKGNYFTITGKTINLSYFIVRKYTIRFEFFKISIRIEKSYIIIILTQYGYTFLDIFNIKIVNICPIRIWNLFHKKFVD